MRRGAYVRLRAMVAGALLLWAPAVLADADKKPDNTGVNKRDRDGKPTADQQKNNGSDLELTRKIRKSIVDDKDLSMYAHNVKIIVRDGSVILRGPVRSEPEKKAVEDKAAEVAGAANVKSEIEISPAKK